MKRAHWLWCGGGLPALVVVLLVAGAPAVSALLIATLLACPLMMLIIHGTTCSSSASHPQTEHQPTPARFSPSQIPVERGAFNDVPRLGGMGGWMMISYGFVVLLILVGIVVAFVALSRRTGRNGPTATPTAKELLAQLYARGEIDDDEYFQRLSVLDSNREPARRIDGVR
jgi:putative membrane protein